MNVAEALAQAQARLSGVSDTAMLDSQVLLAHLLQKRRPWILAHPEGDFSPHLEQELASTLSRLENGLPLPYLLGHWEFFGLDFSLTPDVLIPRPETEMLVETALAWLKDHPASTLATDIGTGCGCIAISLAVKAPNLHLLATDISLPALKLACQNARKHAVAQRIDFIQGDLLPPVHRQINLVCANLPYIPSDVLPTLKTYSQEPISALDGGAGGLEIIRRLLALLSGRLSRGGLALLEIGSDQGKIGLSLAQAAFPAAQIQVLPDLAGLDRLLVIQT